ncbi:MAG: cupin domain-containing protein [Bacillota bacterium]|nr:cupin domain-containing protein [Bacillota bacterium]
MKLVYRFEPDRAARAHEDTILAAPVIEGEMHEPFDHAWGYLSGPGEMERHAHPTYEVYLVVAGAGFVEVDGERQAVGVGDVINIPPNALHTMINESDAPFQWAAFWWSA